MTLLWCHTCDKVVQVISSEFICPQCQGEFIEVIDSSAQHSQQSNTHPSPLVSHSPSSSFPPLPSDQSTQNVSSNHRTISFPNIFQALNLNMRPSSGETTTTHENSSTSDPTRNSHVSFNFPAVQDNQSDETQQSTSDPSTQLPSTNRILANHIQTLLQTNHLGQIPLNFSNMESTSTSSSTSPSPSPSPNPSIIFQFGPDQGQHLNLLIQRIFGQLMGQGNIGDYVPDSSLQNILDQLYLQYQQPSMPRTSTKVISSLPVVVLTDEMAKTLGECPVCKSDFEPDESAKELPCHHHYHPLCIDKWLEMSNICPLCRFELEREEMNSTTLADSPNDFVSDLSSTNTTTANTSTSISNPPLPGEAVSDTTTVISSSNSISGDHDDILIYPEQVSSDSSGGDSASHSTDYLLVDLDHPSTSDSINHANHHQFDHNSPHDVIFSNLNEIDLTLHLSGNFPGFETHEVGSLDPD